MNPPPSPIDDGARPSLEVAVVMRRERLHGPSSHWQPWRWTLEAVMPDEPGFGSAPRLLQQDGRVRPFAGRLDLWPVAPLDDTAAAGQDVRHRLGY